MENLAHILTGVLVSRTGLGSKVPYGTATLVIAANLPDLDSIAGFKGSLYYLHYHRGITHSVFGTLILAIVFTALVWVLKRWSTQKDTSLSGTLIAILIALATHPILDYTNSYGLWPFLPFSDQRVFGDLVFIVDPYLWLLLGGGVYLSGAQSRWSSYLWMLGLGLLLMAGVALSLVDPAGYWFLAIALFAVGAFYAAKRRLPGLVTQSVTLSLAGMLVYWGILFVCHEIALGRAHSMARDFVSDSLEEEVAVLPRPADPFTWDILFEYSESVYFGRTSFFRESSDLGFTRYRKNLNQPEVQVALGSCPGKVLEAFGRFEFYEVKEDDQGTVVWYRDARFSRQQRDGFGTFRIPLTSDSKHLRTEIPCP
jgi:inner membrane protein